MLFLCRRLYFSTFKKKKKKILWALSHFIFILEFWPRILELAKRLFWLLFKIIISIKYHKQTAVFFEPRRSSFNQTLCVFSLFSSCLSLQWRLVCDRSKMNGWCPTEHILFRNVQCIMPINQQYVCVTYPRCCRRSSLLCQFWSTLKW